MSGGPWITSDKAMRHIVYSETTVSGGKKLAIKLDQPNAERQAWIAIETGKKEM
jgi:hypothetical protein